MWASAEVPGGFDGPPQPPCVSDRGSSTLSWGQPAQFNRQIQTQGHCVLCQHSGDMLGWEALELT